MNKTEIINLADCVAESLQLSFAYPETAGVFQDFALEAVKGILTGNITRVRTAGMRCSGRILNIGMKTGNLELKRFAGKLLNAAKKISGEHCENILTSLIG